MILAIYNIIHSFGVSLWLRTHEKKSLWTEDEPFQIPKPLRKQSFGASFQKIFIQTTDDKDGYCCLFTVSYKFQYTASVGSG
jgi:hypothetical protein